VDYRALKSTFAAFVIATALSGVVASAASSHSVPGKAIPPQHHAPQGKRDYYKILGIGKSASADEIKKAYRKTASITPTATRAITLQRNTSRRRPRLMKCFRTRIKKPNTIGLAMAPPK
jgi:hypothetical protein